MKANVVKRNGPPLGQSATDSEPKPGDFPLGSPESRAAARAILILRTTLSPYDEDCYILYRCTSHLYGHANPDSRLLQSTPFYKHGGEIRDEINGPIIPCHLDPEDPRRTYASILFEGINGRVPNPGDILTYEEVADLFSADKVRAKVERIQGAWARHLPEHPCPFKCEGGKMLIHQDDETWQPDWDEDAATLWSEVEDEAFGRVDYSPYYERVIPDRPTVPAVVFIETKDGVRRVKPIEATTDFPRGENRAESPLVTP